MKTRIIVLALALLFVVGFAARSEALPFNKHNGKGSYPTANNARLKAPWFSKRVGIKPSVYTGYWYDPKWESVRKCIVQRESNGYYGVNNNTSSASGAYQFLIGTSDYVARKMGRNDLVGTPAGQWTRWEQDKAFYRLWNFGQGRGHWAGGNYSCF